MASPSVTEHESAHASSTAVPASGWALFRGALAVAVVLLLVGALAWLIFGAATGSFVDTDAKRVAERTKILADRNAEDAKLLHDPASWQDKGKGIVRVPIERAIDFAMADLKKVQPHPAYPLKQSPPQPANAPTAANKGTDVPEASAGVNAPASNPTVGQPSPAPTPTPTPVPVTSASNAKPSPSPAASTPVPTAPTPAPTSAPTPAPTATPTPTATPSPTSAPTPTPTPVPTATPLVSTPSPDNNANNPGSPPVPGTAAQSPAPTAAPASSATPPVGSKPEPLMTPPTQPTPASATTPAASDAATPTPAPGTPGASPAGTP